MTRFASAAIMLSIAGTATAQAPGSLLFVTDNDTGGSDTINLYDYAGGSISTLYTFPAGPQSAERHGGLYPGPNGEYYVANNPFPALEPSIGTIDRVDGLLSGAPVLSTYADGDEVQNTTGMIYDPYSDSMLTLNNPGSNPPVTTAFEGVQSHDYATGSYDGLVVPPAVSRPGVVAVGGGIRSTGRNAGEFYFGSLNGGVDFDASQGTGGRERASAIARLQLNDPANPLDDTTDILIDLSPSVTGNGEFISLIRGMDVLPSGNLIFSDLNSRSIWELEILANGDAGTLSRIVDADLMGRSVSDVIYNPFTNKINYVEFTGLIPGEQEIIEINLDGSGRNVLTTGLFGSGSLVAIPAPASAMLLGLGGIAAVRRRR